MDLLTDQQIRILADRAAIETLFLALLDNAVKSTPPEGSVRFSSSLLREKALIEIRGSGVGIAPDDLPRIFNRFFRADEARSREVPSSALGLSIVR